MKKRFLLVGLAAGIVLGAVGTASAVTLASSPTYSACSTSGHVLLVQVKGKCPSGSHKVTISARGPQGKTGAAGKAAPFVTYRKTERATGPSGQGQEILVTALCPGNSYAVSGGGWMNTVVSGTVERSTSSYYPEGVPDFTQLPSGGDSNRMVGWQTYFTTETGGNNFYYTYTTYVVCTS